MTKKYLVTGGAGFVGSHLCARLLEQGHQVICLDNFYTGSALNVTPLLASPNFQLVEHDVIDAYSTEVDGIYNLACPASPVHYQADPIKTMKTSVLGALNLLDLAHHLKCPILQASTSEVYGDPKVHPQKEEYWGHVNPNGIRSCYDEGKRCAESLFMDYQRHKGVDVRIARIFNTYGPNMNPKDGRVVSNFIVQALKNQAITLYGNGEQTRSFCYVSDLVEGLMRLMNSNVQTPVNLGNPSERTVKDLAEKIIHLTGSQSSLVYLPLPQDDPMQRCPDITQAQQQLNWQPSVSIEAGLHDTVLYFKNRLLSENPQESLNA